MRFSLPIELESRDGTSARGARIINGYVDVEGKQHVLYKRAALAAMDTSGTSSGGGLHIALSSSVLYTMRGTLLTAYGTATTVIGTVVNTTGALASFASTP